MVGLRRDQLSGGVNERSDANDARLDGMEGRLELVLGNQRAVLDEIRRVREPRSEPPRGSSGLGRSRGEPRTGLP
jgi:hypothetical protein